MYMYIRIFLIMFLFRNSFYIKINVITLSREKRNEERSNFEQKYQTVPNERRKCV